jgi:hypothetical protein
VVSKLEPAIAFTPGLTTLIITFASGYAGTIYTTSLLCDQCDYMCAFMNEKGVILTSSDVDRENSHFICKVPSVLSNISIVRLGFLASQKGSKRFASITPFSQTAVLQLRLAPDLFKAYPDTIPETGADITLQGRGFLGSSDLSFQCSSSLGILGGSKFLFSNCKFFECNLVGGLKNFTSSFSKLFFDSSNLSSYGSFLGCWGFSKLLF